MQTAYNAADKVIGWWNLHGSGSKVDDTMGKYKLTHNGTVPVRDGRDGVFAHAQGPFSDTNYLSNASAALNTEMAGLNDYIITFNLYIRADGSPIDTTDTYIDFNTTGSNWFMQSINPGGILPGGTRWFTNGNITNDSQNYKTSGVWYNMVYRATAGNNKKIYVNGVLNTNSNQFCKLPDTGNHAFIGRWNAGGGAADGSVLSRVIFIKSSDLRDIP